MPDIGDIREFLKASTAAEGDISDVLKDASVSDLSWLEVDAAEYRANDTLPKQNLDIGPDLEALWDHKDKPATTYFPKDHRPHTMGDLSEQHGVLRASPEDIMKTARLAVMQSSDPQAIRAALVARYDLNSLQGARTALASVLAERGLLGKLYIVAADFPGCHNSPKKAVDFVRRYASDAKYIEAKSECGNCVHATRTPTGGSNCAVFHKELVVQVPYSPELASQVEQLQIAKGKSVQASAANTPAKDRIRQAFLANSASYGVTPGTPKPVVNPLQFMRPTMAPDTFNVKVDLTRPKEAARAAVSAALRSGRLPVTSAQGALKRIASAPDSYTLEVITAEVSGLPMPERPVYTGIAQQIVPTLMPQVAAQEQLVSASNLLRKRDEDVIKQAAARKAAPVVALLRREMLKGRSAPELIQALKLGFVVEELTATREHWEPLFREAGLYGTVYTTQSSFDECREGADFLSKHASPVRAIVAEAKCEGCIYNKIGRCLLYGKPLVKEASEVVTWQTAEAVLTEYKHAGRIASWAPGTDGYGKTPGEAIRAIHRDAAVKPGPAQAGVRTLDVVKAFHGGGPIAQTTSGLTRREIVKTARRYQNEGLYGNDMMLALKARFDVRDLVAAKEELRPVIAEQGLQGIFYVDPTVYDDYGRGCDEPARLFRAKGVEYVKTGSACSSCVLQTQAGFCSKINKPLVSEPPYIDKAAQQREVLASGPSTEVSYGSIMNNGLTMMAEYQLQNGEMQVDVNNVVKKADIDVSFDDNQKITF